MSVRTLFYVNGEKLRNEFNKRKLSQAAVAREMGISAPTIHVAVNENKISQITMNCMELKYHIRPADVDFKNPDGAEEKIQENEKQITIDHNGLYKTIYSAVFNAVKQAWREM